jgi:hypothetical protein
MLIVKRYNSGVWPGISERVDCAAVDGKNNARLLGGDVFEVEITGPENCAPKAEVTDNNNGWGCAIFC